MYICGYFALSYGPNREVIWIIPILWVILGQNVAIRPPGRVSIYRVTPPPTVLLLILKKYNQAWSWMYICGYIALSHGPNSEVLWIIPIFWVIFCQNKGI